VNTCVETERLDHLGVITGFAKAQAEPQNERAEQESEDKDRGNIRGQDTGFCRPFAMIS